MKHWIPLLAALLLLPNLHQAQNAKSLEFKAIKLGLRGAEDVPKDYPFVQLYSIEAPRPDGPSVRDHLANLKIQQALAHPRNRSTVLNKVLTDSLTVTDGRQLIQLINGFEYPVSPGIPSDNSLAISKDGILLLAFNSALGGYDLNTGEMLYTTARYPLGFIGLPFNGPSSNFYDPKVLYDEQHDRFILVFLRGNLPNTSGIIVAFSTTNDPRDGWNAYLLSGNPLSNNRWTDFPTIAITKDELIFTANFIVPNEPWQTGFDGSMIWQMGLSDGYSGASDIDSRLWYDIFFNGKYIRNIHAVPNAEKPDRDDLFLLSNRNFSLSNDTTFLVHLSGKRDDPNTHLEIKALIADQAYGVPPNAWQEDTDTTDPGSGFDTNDGRILGAFYVNDHIQFVSNTMIASNGRPGIYHGIINDPYDSNPILTTDYISHPRLDLGYPNIVWTGRQSCERQSILGFNHTSFTDYPGFSAVYFSDLGEYSPITYIKKGENYVNRHSGRYERWGDYFGLQRDPNNPSEVWASGYFGKIDRQNGVYAAKVLSPDTMHLSLSASSEGTNTLCQGAIEAIASGGLEPYRYWFNGEESMSSTSSGFCLGDTVTVTTEDALGCKMSKDLILGLSNAAVKNSVYPNPSTDQAIVRFTLTKGGDLQAVLSNSDGKQIQVLKEVYSGAGTYELSFQTTFLSAGIYFVSIYLDEDRILSEKLIRP